MYTIAITLFIRIELSTRQRANKKKIKLGNTTKECRKKCKSVKCEAISLYLRYSIWWYVYKYMTIIMKTTIQICHSISHNWKIFYDEINNKSPLEREKIMVAYNRAHNMRAKRVRKLFKILTVVGCNSPETGNIIRRRLRSQREEWWRKYPSTRCTRVPV